jgi:aspartyl-tRNA(Asn)/glutamyl-tRNA(Gln) amidotransferase subunit C
MTKNNIEEVLKVAKLAKLCISNEDTEKMSTNFNNIISLFEKLKDLDTSEIAEFSHFPDEENKLREDQVVHSITTEQAFSNATQKEGNNFKTPLVID